MNPIKTTKKITVLPPAPRLAAEEVVFEAPSEMPSQTHQLPQGTREEANEYTDPPAPAPPIGRNKVLAVVEAPVIQYANGKSMARPHSVAGGRFAPLVGFYSEVGKDGDFDAAMLQLGTKKIEVKHQRAGGAEIVTHWSLGEELRI